MKTLQAFWKHAVDWSEGYFHVPLALLLIPAIELTYYFATGRRTVDDPWLWIIGYAPKYFVSIMVIFCTSVFHQASGAWLTKEEKFANPAIAIAQMFVTCISLVTFAYIWLHNS